MNDDLELQIQDVCEEPGCTRPGAATLAAPDGQHVWLCREHLLHLDMTVDAILRAGATRGRAGSASAASRAADRPEGPTPAAGQADQPDGGAASAAAGPSSDRSKKWWAYGSSANGGTSR